MNILFLSDYEISPNAGGIERVISALAEMFESRGIKCFSAYCNNKGVGKSAIFNKTIRLNPTDVNPLKEFLTENTIDIVFVALLDKHNFIPLMPKVYEFTRKLNSKVIFTYHTMPGYELNQKINLKFALYKLKHGTPLKELVSMLFIALMDNLGLKKMLYPIIRRKLSFLLYSDLICLLSDRYVDIFKSLVGNPDIPVIAIPNPLPYSQTSDLDMAKKENMVLSVGRFDIVAKRQDLLLDIWSEVEKDSRSDNWTLVIVGYGDEEEYLRKYAERLNLKRVVFTGFCDPHQYYRQASIYTLTSSYEGFGVVLLEAIQYGVVPMAFDSYSAIYDIIEDSKNGYVIPDNHKREYTEKLLSLMKDNEVRRTMAENGFDSCQQFSKGKIADRWMAVLNNLYREKGSAV